VVGQSHHADKRGGEGQGFQNGGHHEDMEGSNADTPPIGETSEDLPF
jgi:hypothetical protein